MCEKIDAYIKEKNKIIFRLRQHQNYFIKGKILSEESISSLDGKENKTLVSIELENGEKYFCYDYEIDLETICPASYNPIFFFLREPISEELKKKVFERADYKCVLKLDGCSGNAEECDHIIPVSQGGLTILENLQAVCKNCNLKKSNKFPF
jgi:hypothetical protein